jgi:hypothetical protein
MSVQWAHLGVDGVLVASSRGAWIQQPGIGGLGILGALGLSGPMSDSQAATEETTRHLLDGAIAAAERGAPNIEEPAMTPRRWAWNLVGQWHCSHYSVELIPHLIERFEATGRPDLAEFARQKLDEERGHDHLALEDLRALGYDAERVVSQMLPARTVTVGLAYARACVESEQPVEFLGYTYALERRVLSLDGDWFKALDAVLPQGVDAASGIRAHATQLDAAHVDEAVAFFAGLPASDRTAIAVGSYRTTQICCAWSPDQIPSDAELEEWFSGFRRQDLMSQSKEKSVEC